MEIIRNLTLLLVAGLLFTACGEGDPKVERKVDFLYVDWAEGVAMVQVAKVLLEENGCKVNLLKTDVAPLFASLSKGNADVFLEAWLPTTHKEYMDRYGESLEKLGSVYEGAKTGLVVPAYVDIQSIEELNDHIDKFGEQIIGIEVGAGIMKTTEMAIDQYELDYKLMSSSEIGMVTALKESIGNEEWIVVTGWIPHWMFSRYDLKILEDPKGIYGKPQTIEAIARKGFSEEQPYIAKFIENMEFTDEQICDLMQVFEEGSSDEAAAKTWITANRAVVDSWIPEDEDMKEIIETMELLR